ncbi:unnamed protein product [Nyctereutes procyonoides]|uniref:(raccoon dog) hypothetical protein n=1 Tax=Nyctereutes procyonoides TaxID=34880 RepID=A0A811YSA9_NYCPR|nr:unnamed protein product [Nyctereutes procyonoides]
MQPRILYPRGAPPGWVALTSAPLLLVPTGRPRGRDGGGRRGGHVRAGGASLRVHRQGRAARRHPAQRALPLPAAAPEHGALVARPARARRPPLPPAGAVRARAAGARGPRPGPAAPEPLAYDYRFVSAPAPAGPDGTPAKPRGRVSSLCGPAPRGASTQHGSPGPRLPTCLCTRPAAPVRPAQSLDDLARAAAAPPAGLLGSAGSFKACSVAGSWVCPRPLARRDSENVYEAVLDVRGPAREERPQQVVDPPEPVYGNVERQPLPTSPGTASVPRPPAWEKHLDAGSGRPYDYNPDTGVTTWESPFEASEGAASPPPLRPRWAAARASRQTGASTGMRRPPTPETDYPESLTSYPEEDYSPVGSLSDPRPTSPLAAPPGWSCHVSPEGQTLYTNHYTQEQWVRLEDQHGHPYFYNPEDTSVQWELPQRRGLYMTSTLSSVPVPAPRSSCKSNQDSETPAQASPPEEKIKTLHKAGVLHRTKTVDKAKRLRKKHWSASWMVLEGGVLTFFKDSKASAAGALRQPPKLCTPEYTVELRGASLSWAPNEKSSRKNVLESHTERERGRGGSKLHARGARRGI